MDRAAAEELFYACEQALAGLNAVESVICKVERDERPALLQALGGAIVETLRLRAKAVLQHPDLEPPVELGPPDTVLGAEEMFVVQSLTADEVESIDAAILAGCVTGPRKVARIVGFAMKAMGSRLEKVPCGYYAQRVAALAESGKLKSDGNLDYMRFSEVWLGSEASNAA